MVLSAIACLVPIRLVAAPRQKPQPVALLVPLTGPSAALGVSMQRAATLAQPVVPGKDQLIVLDTQGTAAGAAAAAKQAMKRDARLILGPLFTAEVRPVLTTVAGRVPVLSFSNDASLRDSGAFLLGVTASQMATAVLRYARGRGVRQIALVGSEGPWSRQAFDAARRLQGELGLSLLRIPAGTAPDALLEALRTPGAAEMPDAVLAPEGGSQFVAIARALRGSDVQLLGTLQALDHAPAALAALSGAWLASPDPAGFAEFARGYEARNGSLPGTIAALAYDAVSIANALRAAGPISREALLTPTGFRGVAGAVRFRADGSCVRDIAILVAGASGYTVADRSAAA